MPGIPLPLTGRLKCEAIILRTIRVASASRNANMYGKILLLTALCAGVNCRYLFIEEPVLYIQHYDEPEQLVGSRVRRDAHGALTVNSDGTSGVGVKVPFAGNDKNILSAIGSVDLTNRLKLGAATAGVALDNM